MRLRGHRRCHRCDTQWSYFDAGEVACPNCGSLRSRGLDRDRVRHTDSAVEIDLAPVRRMAADRPVSAVAAAAAEAARSYLARRGFIDGGDLQPLDEAFVDTAELRQVATALRSRLDPDEAAERYFLALLADGRESPATVPPSLQQAHGLAAVEAVEAYHRDLRRWLDDHPDALAREGLDRLRDHRRRVAALDGDIPPADAARLLDAARALGRFLRAGNGDAIDRVHRRLDRLEDAE